MSGVKRAGDYLAAIFKLGRTERWAKAAYRSVESHDARFGDGELGPVPGLRAMLADFVLEAENSLLDYRGKMDSLRNKASYGIPQSRYPD